MSKIKDLQGVANNYKHLLTKLSETVKDIKNQKDRETAELASSIDFSRWGSSQKFKGTFGAVFLKYLSGYQYVVKVLGYPKSSQPHHFLK